MREDVFSFPALERLIYGKPAAQALAAEVERIGAKRVFLVVSGTMNRTTDEVEKVRAALGNRYAGDVRRDPALHPRSAVLKAAELARSAGTDLVVTFGGGSVTEAGKIVRLCLQHDITDVDGFDRFRAVTRPDGTRVMPQFEGPRIPQIAIPTTLSAGELTTGGGATDERVKRKFSHENPQAIPRTVIFDPAPTVHTPLWVWLSTGVRAIDHATEGLCSPRSNPVSDGMYQHALKLLGSSLLKTKRDPADLDARLDELLRHLARDSGAPRRRGDGREPRDRSRARRLLRRAARLHLVRDAAARAALQPQLPMPSASGSWPKRSGIPAKMRPTCWTTSLPSSGCRAACRR